MDAMFGFPQHLGAEARLGWLMNLRPASENDDTGVKHAVLDLYFMQQDGGSFKACLRYEPYFYVGVKDKSDVREVEAALRRRYERELSTIAVVEKEDMDLLNHLAGLRREYIKLSFRSVDDLMAVRKTLKPLVDKNRKEAASSVAEASALVHGKNLGRRGDAMDQLIDLREYDVPYHVRVAIDCDVRVGYWYEVRCVEGVTSVKHREDLVERPEPKIVAFDIETTKAPLKFPDASEDEIMMISYMLDKKGFLIVNRAIVSEDIQNFGFAPSKEYEPDGDFTVLNEKDEKALLECWFEHMRRARPAIYVTFNGDFFDWPFIDARARHHGMSMHDLIGFYYDPEEKQCKSRYASHMDAFCWVKRDSYLPQGSQGLKAVAKAKLGYDPHELDPEKMVAFARERPQELAEYSVSDAVATWFLYAKYVHPFIFSLCTIIPMSPDEVLRKGSGTLCETLLMVQAFKGGIVCPNKHQDADEKWHAGHLLESETYVGAQVEALESGIFRSDIPCRFRLVPEAFTELISKVDRDLEFALEQEGLTRADATNYDQVRSEIVAKLEALRERPLREEEPLIYHLDVAAMYPNIILTNRLQPHAVVTEDRCAACEHNHKSNMCKREMEWVWRAEYFMATRNDYATLRAQLESERLQDEHGAREYRHLPEAEKKELLLKRVKTFSRTAYKKIHEEVLEKRTATICMRENPFYINTVRAFTVRRYEYKGLHKQWKKKLDEAVKSGSAAKTQEGAAMVVLYDSLQLAHKCILNSFYGYVMRKAARWYSMEMAGVVCHTGVQIITLARRLVEQVGRPLELDTDGIWCMLPGSFPENFELVTNNPKKAKVTVSYPCAMLNADVQANFTNHQYQDLADARTMRYDRRSECTILFEVDGPYKAMVLPASKEEGKVIKKRYAVFNPNGSLAELKGFEMKRRGELKLIKRFQQEVFERFLAGKTLAECYGAVGEVANTWLDILETEGRDYEDTEELLELLSESSTMSRSLEDYGQQKSSPITTARRLAEFLGASMVKDKGLNCTYVISRLPQGAPVTERAVPIAIFSAEEAVMKRHLRAWLKDSSLEDFDPRSILDWGYYTERLGGAIQKIITIPAAMQHIENPVPRVPHPPWLKKRLREKDDTFRQTRISEMFGKVERKAEPAVGDMEDFGAATPARAAGARVTKRVRRAPGDDADEGMPDAPPAEEAPAAPAPAPEAGPSSRAPKRKAKAAPRREPVPIEGPAIDEDFRGWHTAAKKRWREIRRAMARWKEEQSADVSPGGRAGTSGGAPGTTLGAQAKKRSRIDEYMPAAGSVLKEHAWHLLEVATTGLPGELRLFASVAGSAFALRLRVPRTVYVNCREPREEAGWARASLQLPHGRPSLHLYEVRVDEERFHSEQMLASWLSDPAVEGVYESGVPAQFRALARLGNLAALQARAGATRAPSELFRLDELRFIDSAHAAAQREEYLQAAPRTLFIYRRVVPAGRIIAAVGSDSENAFLFVVNNAEGARQPPLRKDLLEACARRPDVGGWRRRLPDGSVGGGIAPAALKWNAQYFRSEGEALTSLNRVVQTFRGYRSNAPLLVALQADCSVEQMRAAMPVLRELPVAAASVHERGHEALPALDWQRPAAKHVVSVYMRIGRWYEESLARARYASVPIANLGADPELLVADVFFARRLAAKKHAWWCSPSGRPDVGRGAGDDEFGSHLEEAGPEVIAEGSYRTVTVDIEVQHLAMASVFSEAHLSEHLEGGSVMDALIQESVAAQAGTGPSSSLPFSRVVDDQRAAREAFLTLRGLVRDVWMDLCETRNEQADSLLTHLYRWLRSPRSLFYDPALHRYVQGLVKRVFTALIAEMRKINPSATIVYASFSRIIVETGKWTLEAADSASSFLCNALTQRHLFEMVRFVPTALYEGLLFMDPANYSAVAFKLKHENGALYRDPDGQLQEEESDDEEDEEEGEGEEGDEVTPRPRRRRRNVNYLEGREVRAGWNMARFLPAVAEGAFTASITRLLVAPLQRRHAILEELASQGPLTEPSPFHKRRRRAASQTPGGASSQGGAGAEGPLGGKQASVAEKEAEFVREFVRGDLTQALLSQASSILRRGEDEFPARAGAQRAMGSAALEFVKAVCRAVGLERGADLEADALRRNLLKAIGEKAHGKEARYESPCAALVVPEVVCGSCGACRDVDVCREEGLQEQRWACHLCGADLELGALELALVDALNRRAACYQQQDPRCIKCRQAKQEAMQDFCSCAGTFTLPTPPHVIASQLKTFEKLGEFLNFEYLKQTAGDLLALCARSSVGPV
eukprot:tig00000970_g5849.t1